MKKKNIEKSKKTLTNFTSEFKKFIMRGNVLDLAIGVIVGGAFSKIVSSIVNDILMPTIGLIIGGHDFSSLSIKIGNAKIMYGSFIQNIVDFLIIALCIFIMVKIINKFTFKKEKKEESKKADDIILLEEIRDLLKKKNK